MKYARQRQAEGRRVLQRAQGEMFQVDESQKQRGVGGIPPAEKRAFPQKTAWGLFVSLRAILTNGVRKRSTTWALEGEKNGIQT